MTSLSVATNAVSQGQVTVTYVGNAGFLLTAGGHKILVDGIFSGDASEYTQPADVVELITAARPPFDTIDLILVTHGHKDHFELERVRDYLEKKSQTVFISTGAVTKGLLSIPILNDRVTGITLEPGEKREQTVNGVRVIAYHLTHGYTKAGEEYPNLGFIVEMNGVKFFHSGDMNTTIVKVDDLKMLGLADEQIDIAFLPHWLFRSAGAYSYATEGVPARHYIPMHYHFTTPRLNRKLIKRIAPDAILFEKELDSWIMP